MRLLSTKRVLAPVLLCVVLLAAQQRPDGPPPPPRYHLNSEEQRQIEAKTTELGELIEALRARRLDDGLLADVEIYHKAARWILDYPEEFFTKVYATNTVAVLEEGVARAKQLQSAKPTWPQKKGPVIQGYRSALDGSVQPYGVTIPDSYDGTRPVRLDVNLKGRNNLLNEVEFIRTYLDPTASGQNPQPPVIPAIRRGFKWISEDVGQIELDVFGRSNNAYHWAGEVDVFEAIAAVTKRYRIDPARIVLRGFSMGGCGAWHLALHFPSRWVAAEIGAGFTRSRRYGARDLPPYQQAALRIHEGMSDYALNMFNLPVAGHGGELDPQRQASVFAREQLVREGFHLDGDPFALSVKEFPGIFLTGPQTPHTIHPDNRKQLNAFLNEHASHGRRSPDHIRFVTYTTRYNTSHWVTLDGLARHYERAEVDAVRSADGKRYQITTKNLTRLVLRETGRAAEIDIDSQALRIKPAPEIVLEKSASRWKPASSMDDTRLRKRHGLQGPIDDAFLDPFLCVRPTGVPWNEDANRASLRSLERFARLYAKHFRAHPRIKNDSEVTKADLANYNLALFGDPGSNILIGRLIAKLPLQWTRDTLVLGERKFPASGHLPAMIYPNPLNRSRYLVLNSGLTAEDRDYRGDFLLPRLGDFAVLTLRENLDFPDIVYAGLFDESWSFPR